MVNRGQGFYESREVNDLTHLLRVIANPRDEISVATLLRSPLVEASPTKLCCGCIRAAIISGLRSSRLTPDSRRGFRRADYGKLARFRDLPASGASGANT